MMDNIRIADYSMQKGENKGVMLWDRGSTALGEVGDDQSTVCLYLHWHNPIHKHIWIQVDTVSQ